MLQSSALYGGGREGDDDTFSSDPELPVLLRPAL